MQLLFSIFSLLHALVWILVFQVILVIKNAAVHNLAKGMKNDQFFRLLRVCVFKTLGVMFSRHHAIISQEWTKSFVSSTSKLRHEKGNHYPPHAACCSGFFRIPSKRVLFSCFQFILQGYRRLLLEVD